MEKEFIDELYHQLRLLYLSGDTQEKEAIRGITSHLTQSSSTQGDYVGLLRFLSYYGERFLLKAVENAVRSAKLKANRIVELGAGFGWLGRGLSNIFNVPAVFVDKRQWVFTDVVADLETKNGRKRVLDVMEPGDLIVMSELLHCLNEPRAVLEPFRSWPMVVVEYSPTYRGDEDKGYADSYKRQIVEFGCKPVDSLREVFPLQPMRSYDAYPYVVTVVYPI